jgi:hypothetical protein
MNNIPKTAYFYWGAEVVPYLRYMCFKTFLQFNPDWKVILYVPTQLTSGQTWASYENKEGFEGVKDYSHLLESLGVHICPFDMESLGFSNSLPEVVKSDIIRLHLLATVGGLWSDSDIIFFRPLSRILKSTDHKAYFCYRRGGPTQEDTPKNGPMYHSIGFLAGAPGNSYFQTLLAGTQQVLNTKEYQSVGSPYYKTIFNEKHFSTDPNLFNININTVYPSRAVPGMWVQPASSHSYEIRPETIGWHWYAGHPTSGEFQKKLTEENFSYHDNIICYILKKLAHGCSI